MHRFVAAATLIALISAPATAQQTYKSAAGALRIETVATGLSNPWGLAFLPDGQMLVTERSGQMRMIGKDGKLSPPVSGVPKVMASGQGGLLDVVIDRAFAQNRTVYFCYSEPHSGGGRTALARATLDSGASPKLNDVKVIFRQEGPVSSGNHYGCRIAQASDSNLFLTAGDHYSQRDQAQSLANHIGKIVRITPDGSVPNDNPFVGQESARDGAKAEIWSYGHRNPQGLAIHPTSGQLWEHEHGPRGGDEVNVIAKGKNYGWPVIGYGIDYSGAKIHQGAQKDGMEQPVKYWVPSIAPSGMAFYTGDQFPAWKGSLFVGALAGEILVRLTLDGERVTQEERLLDGLGRIRDVRQGPDGALYLLTDSSSGRVLRVVPAK